MRVAGEIDGKCFFDLDQAPICSPAVNDLVAVRDAAAVLGVNESALDAVNVDGPSQVGAGDRAAVDSFRAEPRADLVVGHYLGLGRFRDLERVMDVVEMTVGDQHEVAAVDILQSVHSHQVIPDPWVDVDSLSLSAADLPRSVPDPREADLIVECHTHPP